MKKYNNDYDNSLTKLEQATNVFIVALIAGMGAGISVVVLCVLEIVKEMAK